MTDLTLMKHIHSSIERIESETKDQQTIDKTYDTLCEDCYKEMDRKFPKSYAPIMQNIYKKVKKQKILVV